jgi:hypothetical protein
MTPQKLNFMISFNEVLKNTLLVEFLLVNLRDFAFQRPSHIWRPQFDQFYRQNQEGVYFQYLDKKSEEYRRG